MPRQIHCTGSTRLAIFEFTTLACTHKLWQAARHGKQGRKKTRNQEAEKEDTEAGAEPSGADYQARKPPELKLRSKYRASSMASPYPGDRSTSVIEWGLEVILRPLLLTGQRRIARSLGLAWRRQAAARCAISPNKFDARQSPPRRGNRHRREPHW